MELMYKCVLFDERNPEFDKAFKTNWFEKEWGWDVCQNSYKLELSLITGLPVTEFGIERGLTILTITADKKCLGFMNLYMDADNAPQTICIGHVYVRPEVRGKGIYKRMLERAEKFAKDINAIQIVAFVHRSNGGSMKAHHKLGFKQGIVGYVKEVQ